MKINFQIKGLTELQAKLGKMPSDLRRAADAVLKDGAAEWERLAKRDAPTNYGKLKQGITHKKIGANVIGYSVVSSSAYSPFMEWGTKRKAVVPADQSEYASQFKGQKGDGNIDDMFMAILEWVKKKGIADGTTRTGKRKKATDVTAYDTAYAIFLSILRNGVKPHPFFFKHKPIIEKKILADFSRIESIIAK